MPIELCMDRLPSRKTARPPACLKCAHYHITWDAQAPYGCSAHGFKSKRNPAVVVYESSGSHCLLFESRKGSSPGSGELKS